MRGNDRSGFYVRQPSGYDAFMPRALPPKPAIDLRPLAGLLSRADQAVGRLDGATRHIPDVELFLGMYVRREALLSSQIEGTTCSLDDVLAFELNGGGSDLPALDVREVVNYVAALYHALGRLEELPISGRLLREAHAVLLATGRGSDKEPGAFRRTQNWVGPAGCTLADASFVPPPPDEVAPAMAAFERFVHDRETLSRVPLLVLCGLAHVQFETIHPFLDGNGRVGRLLVPLLLCERKVLTEPVLYLSLYLLRHRARYFELLGEVRDDGSWESWLEFFLTGVEETASEAALVADEIHELRERDREHLRSRGSGVNEHRLLDALFSQPLVNAAWVEKKVAVSKATANALLARLVEAGVLRETTGAKRNRVFRYDRYLALFDRASAPVERDETSASCS